LTPDGFAEHYALLGDHELLKLAARRKQLTADAREALAAELRRRGLGPHSEPIDDGRVPPVPAEYVGGDIDPDELVVIRKFRDFPGAMIAKGCLDSAGIECFLMDENVIRMDWFYSNLLGGLKLAVREEDAEAALDLLEQPIPEEFDVEGVGNYEQPRCPKCSSLDIGFESIQKAFAVLTAAAVAPVVIPKKRWTCNSCGNSWREETGE
jgi:hypothetical protein